MAQGPRASGIATRRPTNRKRTGTGAELFGGSEALPATTKKATSSLDRIQAPSSIRERLSVCTDSAHRLSSNTRLLSGRRTTRRRYLITAPLDAGPAAPTPSGSGIRRPLCRANRVRMAQAIEEAGRRRLRGPGHSCTTSGPAPDYGGSASRSAFGATGHRSCGARPFPASRFILTGAPQSEGQPLLVDWQMAYRPGIGGLSLEQFDSFIERARLKAASRSGQNVPVETLQGSLPQAVQAMHAHMIARQAAFAADMSARLRGTLAELEDLQGRQIQQLELQLEKVIEGVKRSRFERRSRHIHRVFDDYRQWVEDTLTTEPQPYVQVLAAVWPNPSILTMAAIDTVQTFAGINERVLQPPLPRRGLQG